MDLRTQSIDGFRWIGTSHALRTLLNVLTPVVLARFLTPAEFGHVGMALAIVGLLLVTVELGFRQVFIQHPDPDNRLVASAWWLNLAAGVVLMLVVIVLADFFAALYREPVVAAILVGLAPLLPLSAIRAVPLAMLERHLEFRRLAVIEALATVLGVFIAIAAAIRGFGAFSIVAQMLVASAAFSLLLFRFGGWLPSLQFSTAPLRQVWKFGRQATMAEAVDFLGRHVDDFLIGRFLGAQSLGYYGIAYQVMLFPLLAITRLIARILFPAAARVQHDNARLRDPFVEVAVAVGIVSFPIMLGAAMLAEPLILLIFGERWVMLIPLVQILAPIGAVQSVVTLADSVFLAKGRADLQLRWRVIQSMAAVLAVVIGLRWGVIGVAIAYAFAYLCVAGPLLTVLCRVIDLSTRRLLAGLSRPMLAALGMIIAVRFMNAFGATPGRSEPVALLASVAVGFVSYAILILLLEGRRVRRLASELRGRRPHRMPND